MFHPRGDAASSTWFHASDWLDFNCVQSGHKFGSPNYRMMELDYGLDPPKPCMDNEPSYEGAPENLRDGNPRIDDSEVRKGAYWALFAGAFGHTYGANEIFQFWNPGGEEPAFGARLPWKTALELPGSFQMEDVRRLLESRPFVDRVLDQGLIVGQDEEAGMGHVSATRGSAEDYCFVYASHGQGFTVILTGLRVTGFERHGATPVQASRIMLMSSLAAVGGASCRPRVAVGTTGF